MPIVCVDLVIERGDEVLVVKRRNQPLRGSWFVPGGRLYRNERIWNAAKRISREETGLQVRVLEKLGWDETWYGSDPFGHGKGTHTVNCIVRCLARKGAVHLDSQHSAYSWVHRHRLDGVERLHERAHQILDCGHRYEVDGVDDPFEAIS